jgi:hypothetical protein
MNTLIFLGRVTNPSAKPRTTAWTTPDSRNTPSTTNLEEELTVDDLGNDGNASMSEQFQRHNPWRKLMMMMI